MRVIERIRAVTTQDGRFRRHKIMAGGRVLACFNPANDTSASFLLRRPSLHPVYTPAGLPVTEQGAHNYPHHKGVFLTLGKINHTNVYVDTTHNSGRLEARAVSFAEEGPALVMDTEIAWLDEADTVLITERRIHRFYAGELGGRANRIDIDSRLRTPLAGGADLPKNKHAYFHCRVLDAIDEEDGGTVAASNGIVGADAVLDTDGYWIDTRGYIGPHPVGIVIMVHPRFGPQPLFARAYGTVALNPFAREGRRLEPGEVYRNVYCVWAYDHPEAFDVARAFEEFARTAVIDSQAD
ncbi:MAG: DUF6807 family protein [Chloroflexota bacterium]